MNPHYSFILPAYNEEALIGSTLDTLRASAEALQGGFEIIVVNDSSTDRTVEIAEAKGARVIHVHKRQIGAVRNAGAAVATGEVFVFVDADTLVPRETLLEMARLLEREEIVAGGAKMVLDRPPKLLARLFVKAFLWLYFTLRLAAGGFIFARREAFLRAGRFDERFFAGEEVHLSRALKKLGKLRIVKHPVITSARKFRMKSLREHLKVITNAMRKGPKAWEQREGLDMWYDGQREK